MPNWTKDQLKAINESGKNIIVSAGAGSGKTAVLTQRVITKLESGTNIQNLLILTFTNAAATEMKDRIRSAIKKNPNLKDQLDYIDSSYITTFDSFSSMLVRKYHYLLNVSPNISIIEKSICDNVRKEIIDEIFEDNYKNKDTYFLKLINDLCVKDDSEIKKGIISINEKLDRLIDTDTYLNNYIEEYYSEENINTLVNSFLKRTYDLVNNIKFNLDLIAACSSDKFYDKMKEALNGLVNSKTYSEIQHNLNNRLPNLPNNCDEELTNIKNRISEDRNILKKILIYKSEEHIKSTLLSTKNYAHAIIDIVSKLNKKLFEYKSIKDEYEFNDIAKMAIKLVKENDEVRKEIRDTFTEIMVDEYQDTSDIQEELISLISNNNVYMVGDIKQSIYRFRNANPDIFKYKYDKYSNNDGGIKIDLLSNFRSRKEVLEDINRIFNLVMSDTFGGADYITSHQMLFGNDTYTMNDHDFNKNLEIYNYKRSNKRYKNSEYEAFIIANDIKNKINNKYQVLDNETKTLRDANYGDFSILLDRKGSFELYKKVFEYLGVPLVIYYDEKITNEKDVLIIKSIIDIIIRIYNKDFGVEFKHDFYSIARSYIINMSDQEYADILINNSFFNTELFNICSSISNDLINLSNSKIIDVIVEKFNFYEKTISVGEIEKFIVRIDYLKTLGDALSSLGYSVIEFNDYLQDMVINDSDITFSLNTKVENNVKLMNIHKSKGLEFSICYFAGYSNKFNKMDLNERISFDSKLGFILPFYDDGIGNTIIKDIYKNKYNEEDISERIRLFYVALTRAKEKMIIVCELPEDNIELCDEVKKDYKSFLDIMNSIKDKIKDKIVNIENVELTKDYNINKEKEILLDNKNDKLIVNEINIENRTIESSQVSKHINKLLTSDEVKTMEYGTSMHRMLEVNDNNEVISDLLTKLNIKDYSLYKEYEFLTLINNKEYHGIIDLMIECNDIVYIVDYKLKNIDDTAYVKQLEIYKNYIHDITNKCVKTYLYSIIDKIINEINC